MRIDDAGSVEPSTVGSAVGSSLWDSMANFSGAAARGEFTVSERGGEALLAVIGRFKTEMLDQEFYTTALSVPPPLGRLKAGEVMSPFMVQVATDGEGFVTRLNELKQSLTKAEEGIRKAMENYQAADEAGKASMSKQMGGLG